MILRKKFERVGREDTMHDRRAAWAKKGRRISIFITTGFSIMADNIYLLAAAFFMFCFHYIPYKKKVEGDRLKNRFGSQYEDYDEKVPEYLPRTKRNPDH